MKNIRLLCTAILVFSQISHAATFTVTTTNDSGAGSLRQAILDANTSAAVDTIAFSIGSGVKTITPATALPAVTNAVVIDGTTQPGFAGTPLIEVDGTLAGANGVVITAGNSTVRGLVINGFIHGIILGGGGTNVISGNFIGTDLAGTTAKANSGRGIWVTNSAKNVIGGTTASARNVISGNGLNGVEIFGLSSISNVVQGNYIGVTSNGSNGLGNDASGILIERAPGTTVGGTSAGAGNVISGNHGHGIYVFGAEASGALIRGNFVGLDATGTFAIGNFAQGIRIEAGLATIGGADPGARNVVAASGSDGILLTGSDAANCRVAGNYVGTRADGSGAFLGNTTGILLSAGAHNNIIGGPTGNLIAYNLGDGVLVVGGPLTVSNSIYGNMIFSNAGLGINLEPTSIYTGTVTTNDLGDADTGGNNLQNFPVLNPITNSAGNTVISGTLNSTANRFFYIDLYRSSSVDPSGYGEGEIYIGFPTLTTDASGNGSFTYNLTGTFPNQYFTATATDSSTDDTSEFSQAAQAATGRFVFLTNNITVNENAGTVFITVNRVGGSYGAASVKALPINGTANESDFTFGGATLNFTSGQTNGGFNIAIIDDTTDEPDESFLLQLSSPVGATIGFPGNMTVNILDNDPPEISVPDTHVVEGNSGNRDVVLNFNLSSTSAVPVLVDFVTADGTATSADHQNYAANVSFSPGQTNRVITLSGAVIGDTSQEPNETFFINLSNPINATLARSQAVVTIIDDDPLPTLNIAQITNNSVRLTWTTNAWGFLLESNANLFASWNTVSNTPVVAGTNFAVTNLMGSNAFYRLHFP